jgi:hypothetical protein
VAHTEKASLLVRFDPHEFERLHPIGGAFPLFDHDEKKANQVISGAVARIGWEGVLPGTRDVRCAAPSTH